MQQPTPAKRGRPKGSKNKVKYVRPEGKVLAPGTISVRPLYKDKIPPEVISNELLSMQCDLLGRMIWLSIKYKITLKEMVSMVFVYKLYQLGVTGYIPSLNKLLGMSTSNFEKLKKLGYLRRIHHNEVNDKRKIGISKTGREIIYEVFNIEPTKKQENDMGN